MPNTHAQSKFTFPTDRFRQAEQLSQDDLENDKLQLEQKGRQPGQQNIRVRIDDKKYVAIGGGLGSFMWVNLLRLCGVTTDDILVLGKPQLDPTGKILPDAQQKPYWNYQQLCRNSQIPEYERLRSNSDSCPDNIWGCPGYALREAWDHLGKSDFQAALRCLWQVFAEPTFAETYTPKSGNTFASIDRESRRIGWSKMFRYGEVRALRQLDDGHYAIAYSRSSSMGKEYGYLITKYVHIAVGYPAIRILPIVDCYRQKTQIPTNEPLVVNAYENHEHVYNKIEKEKGGTVLVQGRGIVASRVIQKLYELNRKHEVKIIHLVGSPQTAGSRFEKAQRPIKHHQELQPFNWPKACWGGDLKQQLETATPQVREKLLEQWGGASTADRRDWQQIIEDGLNQNWYKIRFGKIEKLEQQANQLMVTCSGFAEGERIEKKELKVNFLVDATGLISDLDANPFLKDLVTHYQLERNSQKRLSVNTQFEIPGLRTQTYYHSGRCYASGILTSGGTYAPVDSFLGLQYAALCAVDDLARQGAPAVEKLNGWRSLKQWWRWVCYRTPEGKRVTT
jgi:hypothetical protein